jgi:DNA polymerase III, delta subunit
MSAPEQPPGFLSLGQATARAIVLRAAANDRLQRTLLVHGPAGAGKDAFVDDLIALLLCTATVPTQRPCNACRGCRDARLRSHPDLVIGSPESWREDRSGAGSIVAAARRWLAESVGAPIAGERRVILIEGVDRANEQIQNALLKALEEPTGRHLFVLVADEISRVLPTIRSRSQALRIGVVPRDELTAWLVDRHRIAPDQADALARISEGLSGRAADFAENPALVTWRRQTQHELLDLLARGPADRFGSARELLDEASRLHAPPAAEVEATTDEEGRRTNSGLQRLAALRIVDAWISLARDLLVTSAGRPRLAPSAMLELDVAGAASRIDTARLPSFVILLERTREGLLLNAAPQLALQVAMLSWPQVESA